METDKLMAALQPQVKGELQQIEWKQPVSGEEGSFIKALDKRPINKSTIEELKQVLRLVMVKVGLRANNFPTDGEKEVLLEHIITNYGNHTPEEVKLAFDMAIAGKLELEDKEVTCYENFSCLYFSKILNAYRRWATQTHQQLKKDYPKMVEEKIILTDEDKAEWIMEWKQKEDINMELIPLIFYDFMEEKNLLRLSKIKKWEYVTKATEQIKTQLFNQTQVSKSTNEAYMAYNKFCNMEKDGFTGEFKGRILNRAKRLVIYDYLKDQIQ